MALACLASEHAKRKNSDVLAFIVDHQLRPTSAQEAQKVTDWCRKLGLEAKILTWTGQKPKTGIQEAARSARYSLLCQAAIAHDCSAIATGHTMDDQAETVFMRIARGSTVDGMAAMSGERLIASGGQLPIRLLRPLLMFSRSSLRAFLLGQGQEYIDDPSNEDPKFERIKTRALLAALEAQGLLTKSALNKVAARATTTRKLLDLEISKCFAAAEGTFHRWGGAQCGTGLLDQHFAVSVLQRIIFAVSGSENPPSDDAVAAILPALERDGAQSLGGALIERRGQNIWVYREPGAVVGRAGVAPIGRAQISPGQTLLWDGRFIIRNNSENAVDVGLFNGEAGIDPAAYHGPVRGLVSMPAIWDGSGLVAAPLKGCEIKELELESLASERFFQPIHRFS